MQNVINYRNLRMKQVDLNLIIQKAKLKDNGVFSFRGILYRVVDNEVRFLAHSKEIYQLSFGFLVQIGSYDYYDGNIKKKLLQIVI